MENYAIINQNVKIKDGDKMEENWKYRTEKLIGKEAVNKLENAKVIVFGIGGVGSFAVEGLVRAGVGNLSLVDPDNIDVTNINRQIHSNVNTVGKSKIEVMKQRILEINPKANVEVYNPRNLEFEEQELIDNSFSYVIDAVDTIKTKINIIEKAKKVGIPVISAMGAGNKIDSTKFEVTDINKTDVCPLARTIRKELRKRNIKDVKVVYSKEEPVIKGQTPASISYVPSICGLIIAGEVIKDIIKNEEANERK